MVHFAAFLDNVFKHFFNTIGKSFDFIKISRIYNSIVIDLEEHLLNFFKYISSFDKLIGFAAPVITSSLVLNNYPLDVHYI